jgi:hypothetical protein
MSNTQVIIKHVHAFADTTMRSGVTGQQPLPLQGRGQSPYGTDSVRELRLDGSSYMI